MSKSNDPLLSLKKEIISILGEQGRVDVRDALKELSKQNIVKINDDYKWNLIKPKENTDETRDISG